MEKKRVGQYFSSSNKGYITPYELREENFN